MKLNSSLAAVVVALAASSITAQATRVLWTAKGKVTSSNGSFSDVAVEQEVNFRMTYDDSATPETLSEIFGRKDVEYRTNIDLKMEISIDDKRWVGEVGTGGTQFPRTFLAKLKPPPTPETLEITISEADNGEFPEFATEHDGDTRVLNLLFTGKSSDFIFAGITSDSFNVPELSEAIGSISHGDNELEFDLDPESVVIIDEEDANPPSNGPMVKLSKGDGGLKLSWPGLEGFEYEVQAIPKLAKEGWIKVETFIGANATISRDFPLSSETGYFRVVAIPLDPGN